MENIFEKALGIETPWHIETTEFDTEQKRFIVDPKNETVGWGRAYCHKGGYP